MSRLTHQLSSAKARYRTEEGTNGAPAELQARRKLHEHGGELGLQSRNVFIEARDLRGTALQVTFVRDAARHFHRETKRRGCLVAPARIGGALMRPIEGRVDLHAGEMRCVIRQVRLTGISLESLRRRVAPSGQADPNRHGRATSYRERWRESFQGRVRRDIV